MLRSADQESATSRSHREQNKEKNESAVLNGNTSRSQVNRIDIVSSKASSVNRRLKLEAQMKADEEMAKILAAEEEIQHRKLEHQKKLIRTRLELENARIDEEVGSEKESEENLVEDKWHPKVAQEIKVRQWLEDVEEERNKEIAKGDIFRDDMKKFLARQTIDRDLPFFSGDVKEWPGFYCQYKSTTEVLELTNEKNLSRLRRCLKGDARRPDLIVRSLVNEAKNMPYVKGNDFNSIIHFAETISNLVVTLEGLKMSNYLECPQLLDDLLQKLPYNLQLAWGEKVARGYDNISLKEFKNWIWEKSEGASFANAINASKNMSFNTDRYKNKEKIKHTVLTTRDKSKKIKCFCCLGEGHTLEKCMKFNELEVNKRWEIVKKNLICFCCLLKGHRLNDCYKRQKCPIVDCEKYHHKILHNNNYNPENVHLPIAPQIVAHTAKGASSREILLRIAPVTIFTLKNEVKTYALFDEASTISLIDEDLANSLDLYGTSKILDLKWTDKSTCKNVVSRKVSFDISGQDEVRYHIDNVYTMGDLDLPVQSVNAKYLQSVWPHLREINFSSLENVQPKLLLGQDNWNLTASRQIIEGPKNSPVLSCTKLGWIVHGNVQQFKGRIDENFVLHVCCKMEENNRLHDEVKKFFTTESFGVKIPDKEILSREDERAKIIAEKTTRRFGQRWETGLLWKTDEFNIGDSKAVAEQRLKYIERKILQDKDFADLYDCKLDEYLSKGYARHVTEEELCTEKTVWYLPHFGVVNPNKPGKIRFVFDAAAKVEGKSLNDLLLKGPDLYNSLVSILWKFRQKQIAFSADIQEMFHQVHIRKEDQSCQRFLWPSKSNPGKYKIYAMNVMIFGAVSSPFSAQYVKNINAMEFRERFPEACEAIIYKHYMDDYLDSVETLEEAKSLVNQVITIHRKGGFNLRNWVSNSKKLLENIPENLKMEEKIVSNGLTSESQRILGLKWMTEDDTLGFIMSFHKIDKKILEAKRKPSKREILKILMSLFDPLGLLGHYLIRGKILLQDVWRSGISWDDEITHSLNDRWQEWILDFQKIKDIRIPRCYYLKYNGNVKIELHVFCDASEQAFAAVSYFRFEGEGDITVSLVMSRTQVAPLRSMTIPRLELQAAVMASRLAKTVKLEHEFTISETYFWSDSKTVLCWIKSDSRKFKTFVSHRIGEIHENSKTSQWNWIPSGLNIADHATRDSKKIDLSSRSSWFIGPEFLYMTPENWPKEDVLLNNDTDFIKSVEMKVENVLIISRNDEFSYLPNIQNISKWTCLLRSTAYVLRFVEICKKNIGKLDTNSLKLGEFTVDEMKKAELLWSAKSQHDSFGQEINLLKNNKSLSKTSRLYQLSPVLYQNIIYISGRTNNSPELSEETKTPVILDRKHPYTKLLIRHYHQKAEHKGREMILNELRQRYWIIQARKAINKEARECNLCQKRKSKCNIPEMGQLPTFRVTKPPRPFTYVGLDYFGPYVVSIGRRREKRYGVLFTCLSIRAIHLELADSLTTDSAILALRRFIARRGEPKMIISDNGTNFKGASKELREEIKKIDNDLLEKELCCKEIDWKFIPPASPHMGGAWERMVRSVKDSLKITLKETHPKPEVLATLLAEAENIVNSRPLTYVSDHPDDPESITPNHFLIGTSSSAKAPGILSRDWTLRKQWRMSQQLANQFWNRWVREYLPTLTKRSKWHEKKLPLKVNDIVVVMDNQMPRNNWPLGRIVTTYPSSDGQVRVVDVKTKMGTYRRPVTKICKLEFLELSDDEASLGGENVEF